MKHTEFDVIVVGGGHAGVEAAHAAHRLGARTALVTLNLDGIGVMSCNPAIGGLGKGHLVREIDALDGVMGRAADMAGIQFRLLNRRKGPAVQGPRTQADRALYRSAIKGFVEDAANIDVAVGEVADLIVEKDQCTGVVLADGTSLESQAVVLTTGTFLGGVIHIGNQRRPAGRWGDDPSNHLAARMRDFGFPLGRLKTGTPPRLDGTTIDWERLEMQPGDDVPVMFSFLNDAPRVPQISCGITHTNADTHEIIRKNLSRSSMYGGHIEGTGPRYCPSIEDKIVRFGDKESHQVFLEPEGLNDNTVYPNGISTSLPEDVQADYVRTLVGLENAVILRPGYAIEYDFVDPMSLDRNLMTKNLQGLFLAGQINGTTGYEEAAAQGLVAGLNAARRAQGDNPVSFDRTNSYIGVLVDDLTTRGVSEPYRMFTSRAEHRLSLRADNADQRLTPLGAEVGLVGSPRLGVFEKKANDLRSLSEFLCGKSFTPVQLSKTGLKVKEDGKRRTGIDILANSDAGIPTLIELVPEAREFPKEILDQVWRDSIYQNYIVRQNKEAEQLRRNDQHRIPKGFSYDALSSLSHELKEKLKKVQPETIAHAAQIDGMTPAGLTLILAHLRRDEKRKSA